MPKEKDYLAPLRKTLDGLGFKVDLGRTEDGRTELLAESAFLQLTSCYTGKGYVVMVAPSGDDDWFDLRAVLAYIQEGSVRYSKDLRRIYLNPAQYARAIER